MKGISRIAALAAIVYGVNGYSADNSTKVIYGDDNRSDAYEVSQSNIRELADSTVALFKTSDLTTMQSGKLSFPTKIFGKEMGLCQDEPYRDQPAVAFCSGFLVAEDMIATAGHCVTDELKCASVSFVFGHKMLGPNNATTEVDKDQVYKCAQIIAREQINNGQDYAVIKLDRPVKDHKVLKLSSGVPAKGEGLFVVGYPSGLPVKIAGGAAVRNVPATKGGFLGLGQKKMGYFVANLDTYGGNSGSAVFNAETLEVEGILVRGEKDFVFDSERSCVKSNRVADNSGRGEDVTFVSFVKKAVSKGRGGLLGRILGNEHLQ